MALYRMSIRYDLIGREVYNIVGIESGAPLSTQNLTAIAGDWASEMLSNMGAFLMSNFTMVEAQFEDVTGIGPYPPQHSVSTGFSGSFSNDAMPSTQAIRLNYRTDSPIIRRGATLFTGWGETTNTAGGLVNSGVGVMVEDFFDAWTVALDSYGAWPAVVRRGDTSVPSVGAAIKARSFRPWWAGVRSRRF